MTVHLNAKSGILTGIKTPVGEHVSLHDRHLPYNHQPAFCFTSHSSSHSLCCQFTVCLNTMKTIRSSHFVSMTVSSVVLKKIQCDYASSATQQKVTVKMMGTPTCSATSETNTVQPPWNDRFLWQGEPTSCCFPSPLHFGTVCVKRRVIIFNMSKLLQQRMLAPRNIWDAACCCYCGIL